MKNVNVDCIGFYDDADERTVFAINEEYGVIIDECYHGYRKFITDNNGNDIVRLDNYNIYVGKLTNRERNVVMREYEYYFNKVLNRELVPVYIYLYPFANTIGDEYLTERYDCADYIQFPLWIIRNFYIDHEDEIKAETAAVLGKPINECTFNDWFYGVYTADSVEGLFEYAQKYGFTPHLPIIY